MAGLAALASSRWLLRDLALGVRVTGARPAAGQPCPGYSPVCLAAGVAVGGRGSAPSRWPPCPVRPMAPGQRGRGARARRRRPLSPR